MIKHILQAAVVLLMSHLISSCLGDDSNKYDFTEWKNQNETYFADKEAAIDADGNKVFTKISPAWAPGVYVLAQWHNDRTLTASNLVPMDNSTVDVVYECYYVDGTILDTSKRLPNGIYSCKPNQNIVGFWSMLTNMHVGDSVTCVIPMNAAYGTTGSSVRPYSTLIYNMKLQAISAYEISGK